MPGHRAHIKGYGDIFGQPGPERTRAPPAGQPRRSHRLGGPAPAVSGPAAPDDQAPVGPAITGPGRSLGRHPGSLPRSQPAALGVPSRPIAAVLPLAPPGDGPEAGAGPPAAPRGPGARRRPRGLAL